MALFSVGVKVRKRGFKLWPQTGTIIRDLGVVKPDEPFAPLSSPGRPEQLYRVEFYNDVVLTEGRRGYTDYQNCWESDLEPA